jgi:hypothetical protein
MEREEMVAKKGKVRAWTKEDIRMLQALAREGAKTTAIARKLKPNVRATHQEAMGADVQLGTRRREKKA